MKPVWIVFRAFGCVPIAVFETYQDAWVQIQHFELHNKGDRFVVRESTLVWDFKSQGYFTKPEDANHERSDSNRC